MKSVGFLSILIIIICIAGLMTFVGVEAISMVTEIVEQTNAQSNMILK